MDFKQHLECFSKLLDNCHIVDLLKKDKCGAICDKYHLIIVFQFFMRADFKEEDYTARNFFLALTLSHDLYDESKTLKHIIMMFYLSRKDGVKDKTKMTFHWDKLVLYRRMQFRGFVERRICQKLCQMIQHKAFDKSRRELHTGYVDNKLLCDKCRCPMNASYTSKSQKADTSDEISDNSKTPCNMEDVSDIVTEQKAKKARLSSTESAKELFFQDSDSELLTVETASVASSC